MFVNNITGKTVKTIVVKLSQYIGDRSAIAWQHPAIMEYAIKSRSLLRQTQGRWTKAAKDCHAIWRMWIKQANELGLFCLARTARFCLCCTWEQWSFIISQLDNVWSSCTPSSYRWTYRVTRVDTVFGTCRIHWWTCCITQGFFSAENYALRAPAGHVTIISLSLHHHTGAIPQCYSHTPVLYTFYIPIHPSHFNIRQVP